MNATLPRILALVSMLVPATLLAQQDVITVGSATANTSVVQVPIHVRDVASTPLGVDRGAGSKIQSFSIKVDYEPASAISSVSIARAGVIGDLQPTFEMKPSSPGSVSLLATFPESSSLVPFTLNGAGDLVATLTFNLSASAAPGTSIALTLDPSLTQLANEGGTIKQTEAAGSLALVGGSIAVPQISISFTPSWASLQSGTSGQLTVRASANVASDTVVSLATSAPSVATVPASVAIAAGARNAIVTVTASSPGDATITAALPASAGGATATASVTISDAIACATPLAPQVTAPSTAASGTPYTISWPPVANATAYDIEESTSATFGGATKTSVASAAATFTRSVAADTRYHYRVRARNAASGCSESSPASVPVSVLVTAPTLPPVPATRIIAVVGSTAGLSGSQFRTSVQLHNPSDATISGRIVYHAGGASAAEHDPSLAYVLAAGATMTYADLLPQLGLASGVGSADIVADIGSPVPVAVIRVFNDGGAAGTSGLAQEALRVEDALRTGDRGVLFAPADAERFRLNIGVRTLEHGGVLTIAVRNRDGVVVRTVQKHFPASYFVQTSSGDLLDGYRLSGDETLTFTVDSGSAFVYGATTDNITNDPSQQFARRID